jgi:hypothetical protein
MSERGTIQLTGGRIIRLRWFRQHEVYARLLEGLPTREMNEQHIQALLDEARKRTSAASYVVPPREEPIEHRGRYPFGDPAMLPRVACVGHFDSLPPACDTSQDYSSLVIIWFQQEYAFPIEPKALEKIRAIDWDQLAADHQH